mmetsp:Transcript_30636/g.101928  ORF Transcript_30636/g.101928 Transcript_30636/m.101928 type:complete len:354 (-) Transcript_30636:88-1149(-)
MTAPTASVLDALVRSSDRAGGPALRLPRALPLVAAAPTLLGELAVIGSALGFIGSVPGYPILLVALFRRAWKADPEKPNERRRAWLLFGLALAGYVFLAVVPVAVRPALMQSGLWRCWLEYMSVRVAYRSGEALPAGQYLYLMMPHGLYPFSGACASISKMTDVFVRMRMAVAPIGLRIPLIRQLMGWIGCIEANRSSISKALARGDSVGLFPGGIGEMMRTRADQENILLLQRRGFVKEAVKHGIPIVPVYVFGQSLAFGHLLMPAWVERLSRWMRASIILPFGRFGLLIPRKLPLLYAIGAPIVCPKLADGVVPSDGQVEEIHSLVVESVRDLYDFYKGMYGWDNRPLSIE